LFKTMLSFLIICAMVLVQKVRKTKMKIEMESLFTML